MRCLKLPCIALATVLLVGFTSFAAAEDAPIRVNRVQFNSAVNPTKDNNMVIQLRATSNPNPEAPNKDYVDNIRVVVTLGYKYPNATSDTDLMFYRAESEIATLKINDTRSLAFWMPYDLVTRDRYNREPEYWIIELFINGQQVPANRDQVSRTLMRGGDPQAILAGFKAQAEAKVKANDGILRPTYLTINADPERADKILPYIRKEDI